MGGTVVASSYDDWVEVAVTEFPGLLILSVRVVSENSAVGVPFPHGADVGADRLFTVRPYFRSNALAAVHVHFRIGADPVLRFCFHFQHGWSLRFLS